MVNFEKLLNDSQKAKPINPVEIFEELPKSGNINSLYDSQAKILRKWNGELRNERDVFIELNTGGGKTLVGLLIALSIMREKKSGVLYLVENKQLAGQVSEEAKSLGIPSREYDGGASLDAAFDNGESILIGSYQAFFNGCSTFGTKGSPSIQKLAGIIVDDAHASLDAVRDAFSFVIPANQADTLYKPILELFRDVFYRIGKGTTFEEMIEGVGGYSSDVVEIPFWEWISQCTNVARLITQVQKRADYCDEFKNSLMFNWPLIKDNLQYCQAIVSKKQITITPVLPLLDMLPAFGKADHRIFMSATITDYGDLVRAYDLRGLSAETIITSKTTSGVGRRMILPLPKEVENSEVFQKTIGALLERKLGIVRLTARSDIPLDWGDIPCVEAVGHEEVKNAISNLRSLGCSQVLTIVNRYNGIDLPEDACRVLIMQDLPSSRDDYDILLSTYMPDSKVMNQRLARRIEQGFGRGVRGSGDHCVILVKGERLVDWLKRDKNKSYFTIPLLAQLEMGEKIAEDISDPEEYCKVILQDVQQDEAWQRYHAACLSEFVSKTEDRDSHASVDLASRERRAFALWVDRKYDEAVAEIITATQKIDDDNQYKGWFFSFAARIMFAQGNLDKANEFQETAKSFNRALEYEVIESDRDMPDSTKKQASEIVERLGPLGGKKRVACVSRYDKDTQALLTNAGHKEYEEAVEKLGWYLGYESRREDKSGNGPDVYWVSPDGVGFAIEIKNEKSSSSSLHKTEAGQLRNATAWLKQKYPNITAYGVSIHPSRKADKNAAASNLNVLTIAKASDFQKHVREFIQAIEPHVISGNIKGVYSAISKFNLTGIGFAENWLQLFENEGCK